MNALVRYHQLLLTDNSSVKMGNDNIFVDCFVQNGKHRGVEKCLFAHHIT